MTGFQKKRSQIWRICFDFKKSYRRILLTVIVLKGHVFDPLTHQNFLVSKHVNKVRWQIRRWLLQCNVDSRINRSRRKHDFLFAACEVACSAFLPRLITAASLAEKSWVSTFLTCVTGKGGLQNDSSAILSFECDKLAKKNAIISVTWFESPFPLSTFVQVINDFTCPSRYCAIICLKIELTFWL